MSLTRGEIVNGFTGEHKVLSTASVSIFIILALPMLEDYLTHCELKLAKMTNADKKNPNLLFPE